MKKILVSGYSANEGKREFEILEKEQIAKIIEDVDTFDIYKKTFEKANGYSHSGFAYTYIDARDGKIYTNWLQQNNELHPWDSFYEIILCTVDSPIENLDAENLLDINGEEWDEWESFDGDIEDFLKEKYGEREIDERIENYIEYDALEFGIDDEDVEDQLKNLYEDIED